MGSCCHAVANRVGLRPAMGNRDTLAWSITDVAWGSATDVGRGGLLAGVERALSQVVDRTSASAVDWSWHVNAHAGRVCVTGAELVDSPQARPCKQLIIWHDGMCPLCRQEIALMRRLDPRGAIRFVDAASANAASCPIDRQELLTRFHAMEDGALLSGAAAFAAMWRAIPVLRPLGLLAKYPPTLATLEWAYLAFLKVRPALQRVAWRWAKA